MLNMTFYLTDSETDEWIPEKTRPDMYLHVWKILIRRTGLVDRTIFRPGSVFQLSHGMIGFICRFHQNSVIFAGNH